MEKAKAIVEIFSLFAEALSKIAWPGVVAVCLYAYRKELQNILNSVRRLKLGENEIEIKDNSPEENTKLIDQEAKLSGSSPNVGKAKTPNEIADIENKVLAALYKIPSFKKASIRTRITLRFRSQQVSLDAIVSDEKNQFAIEIKGSGTPIAVREGITQLRRAEQFFNFLGGTRKKVILMIIVPSEVDIPDFQEEIAVLKFDLRTNIFTNIDKIFSSTLIQDILK